MRLPDFSNLFEDGREVSTGHGRVVLRRHEVAELLLTTGAVVACDPSASPETEPFTVAVPAGAYPVVLSVAHFEDGDQRVAGALLRVGEAKPVRWEMALLPGESPAELEADEVFGYPVDSGTGCLMDAEAARKFLDRVEEDEDFYDALADALDDTYVDTWAWASVVLDEATGLNMVVFTTGVGDGLYASYFGLDERGSVVALVTDFSIFEHEEIA